MSLYRKHRPRTFADMVGNQTILEAFRKALEESPEKRPHVFLLSGDSGCGKTTAARIAADLLGADEMAIHEFNSSSNRGIDSAREIIEQMRFTPMHGTSRIYILDEFHQTTAAAQNAFLKPLEDTPDHVYFFICTTNPEKVIKPIHTRCVSFHFPSLSSSELVKVLRRVNKLEGLGIEADVLLAIAENADGSPRKAINILEKVSKVDPEDQLKAAEEAAFGEDSAEIRELCKAILSNKGWKPVAEVLKNLDMKEPENIRYAVMGYMNAVLLNSGNKRAALALEFFSNPTYNTGKNGITLAAYQSVSYE